MFRETLNFKWFYSRLTKERQKEYDQFSINLQKDTYIRYLERCSYPPPNSIIGYQIVSADGKNEIPDGVHSFEVFEHLSDCDHTVTMLNKSKGPSNWVILPVYKGDIEEHSFINSDNFNYEGKK